MHQIKIAFCSKLHHTSKIQASAREGFHFVSRWLETGNLSESRTKPASHWQQENYIDIRAADFVVLFGEEGDNLESASQEIGYAIAWGKPVFVVAVREAGPKPWMLQGEPGVRRRGTLGQVLDEIEKSIRVQNKKLEV